MSLNWRRGVKKHLILAVALTLLAGCLFWTLQAKPVISGITLETATAQFEFGALLMIWFSRSLALTSLGSFVVLLSPFCLNDRVIF